MCLYLIYIFVHLDGRTFGWAAVLSINEHLCDVNTDKAASPTPCHSAGWNYERDRAERSHCKSQIAAAVVIMAGKEPLKKFLNTQKFGETYYLKCLST